MKLIKLLFVVIAVLVVGNVTLANQNLDSSLEMTTLATDIQSLEKENAILVAEIATSGSLTAVEPKISELGFVAPTQIMAAGNTSATVASR